MPHVELYSTQIDAIRRMHNGCVLNGKVGSGKSRTGLAYIFLNELGGSLCINGKGTYKEPTIYKDLYIITTARKRDSREWEEEMLAFGLTTNPDNCAGHLNCFVDSWNNVAKYSKVVGAVFIFDEQRVVGRGAWVKAFLKIAKKNQWILLTGTPGDSYSDYIPLFIANGYYKNRTEFNMKHIVYKPYMDYPVIDHYVDTGCLNYYIRDMLVNLESDHTNAKYTEWVHCQYDKDLYKRLWKDRWNIYDDEPIEESGKLCYLLRRLVNTDESRIAKLKELLINHQKVIIFYNLTDELEELRKVVLELDIEWGEWNGQVHCPVPRGNRWVYLCQYTAAAEAWNCITTDTIIFYSLNYSYKAMVQAAGRIDRSNTPFKCLYYFYLISTAPIDLAIKKALKNKRDFNAKTFC